MQDWKNWRSNRASKCAEGWKDWNQEKAVPPRSEELQRQKDNIQKKIARARIKTVLLKQFARTLTATWVPSSRLHWRVSALELLSDRDFTGKDIPYMHAKTIEYLLNSRKSVFAGFVGWRLSAIHKVEHFIDFCPSVHQQYDWRLQKEASCAQRSTRICFPI